ncbi:TPA: retron St85 family RNA-directed DNA polymerase [Proteus mirabilis]|uniref:retron St85 family RNA-directed DNA polymerase n=1 Tax=Proteus mirabilis TaxID=584 RepID=UPI0008EE6636|nr:retron St85 family RNA-directed DNA polymerase [Proteus mirabilis]EKY1726116.1 retron St85 family RNA-directed DNA polymerase [Proteus mirabilis]ELA7948669.1 retron St85 family RNA-directed DNA polymerase [Proteus mirabilis]MBG3017054.1 RNA-directed DNA polymerase [Proteus mirabilis]MBG3049044.1 RNA-directed DNA polymerase [Proteus mirabilis]MBI6269148.1 retron St85 family RNA-directed DNA polymerase [Proteus mirabilis]
MKYLLDILEHSKKTIDDLIFNYLTAPRKYKEFEIKKRSGGFRKISQPSFDVKLYQYLIMENILAKLPIHDAATAYRYHKSIYHNALPHKNSDWILKLDFKDFFHSIRPKHLKSILTDVYKDISSIEIDILNHYLFWMDRGDQKLKLSIGAPSSPIVSNIVMYKFDETVFNMCSENNVIYTRYADDITLSSDSRNILLKVESELKKIIADTQEPLLILNNNKRVLLGKQKSKRITGVVITHEKKLSVGRYKRKKTKAMLHLYVNNKLKKGDIPILHGTLSYINSIESEYYQLLELKYGKATFRKLTKDAFYISKMKYKNINKNDMDN